MIFSFISSRGGLRQDRPWNAGRMKISASVNAEGEKNGLAERCCSIQRKAKVIVKEIMNEREGI